MTVPNIPLAGHMLDKETLLSVAWWLLLDIYWNNERENKYRDTCRERGDTPEQNLVDRPVSPAVPDELDALMRLMHVCGRIEQAWGRSFFSVASEMYHPCPHEDFLDKLQTLIYRTIMACIGHGIGPDDEDRYTTPPVTTAITTFPDELRMPPVEIENPMEAQLDLFNRSVASLCREEGMAMDLAERDRQEDRPFLS